MAEVPLDKNAIQKRRQSDQVRLESWKAIANHMKRSVRTVRRWEATEGLPVHRHRHTKGFSAYAFESELDHWLSDHRDILPSTSSDNSPLIQSRGGHRLGLYAAIFVGALVVGIVGDRYMLSGKATQESVSPVLISPIVGADFWPESTAQVLVAPIFSAWADGHVEQAYRESQTVSRQLHKLPENVQGIVIDYLVEFSLILGRVDDANTLLLGLSDTDLQRNLEARIAFASGDMTRVRDVLEAAGTERPSTAQAEVFNAMAAMKSGNMAEAKSRFEHASSELVVEDRGYFFVALDMLAALLQREGDLPAAVEVLEQTMPHRDAAARNRSGLFWLMCQRQLAKVYRELGRTDDAEELENVLRDFLILSDADFPLAQSLVVA